MENLMKEAETSAAEPVLLNDVQTVVQAADPHAPQSLQAVNSNNLQSKDRPSLLRPPLPCRTHQHPAVIQESQQDEASLWHEMGLPCEDGGGGVGGPGHEGVTAAEAGVSVNNQVFRSEVLPPSLESVPTGSVTASFLVNNNEESVSPRTYPMEQQRRQNCSGSLPVPVQNDAVRNQDVDLCHRAACVLATPVHTHDLTSCLLTSHEAPGVSVSAGPSACTSAGKDGEGMQKNTERTRVLKQRVQQLRRENRRLKNRRACRHCGSRPVSLTLLPCGHLCLCQVCGPSFDHCPLCHKVVLADVRTFL